jgi:hypothetical protein
MLTAFVIVIVLLAWAVVLHGWLAHRDAGGGQAQHGAPSLEDHRRALIRTIAMRESFR